MPLRLIRPPATAPHGWVGDFRALLDEQYRRLRLPTPACVEDLSSSAAAPELLIYFGIDPWNETIDPPLAQALSDYANVASHALPVLAAGVDAATHLAPAFQRFNAFLRNRYGTRAAEALVDEVLTLIWQRRRQRRIFVSYRRSESQAVARQLHDRYTQRSLGVFLDDRSIAPAVDFQRELRRELDDSDAVLLLLTPEVAKSKWVREEIQFARTRRIGLLGLIWPGVGPDAPGASAAAYQLDHDQTHVLPPGWGAGTPDERVLSESELDDIDRLLFTGRSEAIARRISDLVDCAEEELAPEFTIAARRPDGDLELDRGHERWFGRVAPFRPSLLELFEWWQEQRGLAAPPRGLVVVYPQLDAADQHEVAFRAVCDSWGRTATPRVLLRGVCL